MNATVARVLSGLFYIAGMSMVVAWEPVMELQMLKATWETLGPPFLWGAAGSASVPFALHSFWCLIGGQLPRRFCQLRFWLASLAVSPLGGLIVLTQGIQSPSVAMYVGAIAPPILGGVLMYIIKLGRTHPNP